MNRQWTVFEWSLRRRAWGVWALALAMGASAAHAELLVEPGSEAEGMTSVDSSAEQLGSTPSSSNSSMTVRTVQAPAPMPVQVPVQMVPSQPYPVIIQTAPAPAAAPAPVMAQSSAETNPSRTELVRRERIREEIQNEDLLQERLENLRLQDEKRRTGQLMGQPSAPVLEAPAPAFATVAVAPAAPIVEEQVVSVPVSDRTTASGSSELRFEAPSEQPEIFSLRLAPRAGLSNFAGQSPYAIEGRYTVGVGLDMQVSDNLGFEIGYSFSEYGLALNDATALILGQYLNPYGFNYNGSADKTGMLKQNVVDAGIKVHLLGMASRIRPYIGGGGGYSKSFLNYDPRILNLLRGYSGFATPPDYELSQFLAYASAGLDVRLSKSVSVGANYRHYRVLSSRQNQELYNPALFGGYPGAYYGGFGGAAGMGSLERQYVGGSLAQTAFHSVTATVAFQF